MADSDRPACSGLSGEMIDVIAGASAGRRMSAVLPLQVKVVRTCCDRCPMRERCAGLRLGSAGVWGGVVHMHDDREMRFRPVLRRRMRVQHQVVTLLRLGWSEEEVCGLGVSLVAVRQAVVETALRVEGVLSAFPDFLDFSGKTLDPRPR